MKVIVTLEIELRDPEEWTDTFGVKGNKAIRQDVKEYVYHNLVNGGGVFFDEIEANIKLR